MSRCFGGTLLTTRPPMATSPPSISSRPAIMRSRVLLPQPLGTDQHSELAVGNFDADPMQDGAWRRTTCGLRVWIRWPWTALPQPARFGRCGNDTRSRTGRTGEWARYHPGAGQRGGADRTQYRIKFDGRCIYRRFQPVNHKIISSVGSHQRNGMSVLLPCFRPYPDGSVHVTAVCLIRKGCSRCRVHAFLRGAALSAACMEAVP